MNNKDIYEKGIVLMTGAIEKYKRGEYEAAEKERHMANEVFDEIAKTVGDDGLTELYGENRNFGIAYKVIEVNAPQLYLTEQGRKSLAEMINFIRNDATLKAQHTAYSLLSKVGDSLSENLDKYINEVLNLVPQINRKSIREENEKLIKLIRKNNLNELIPIDEETYNFYDAVDYLIGTKATPHTITEHLKKKNIVEAYIRSNIQPCKTTEEHEVPTIEAITRKYEEDLNEEERQLLDTISSCSGLEKAFKTYKRSLYEKIKDAIKKNEDNVEVKNGLQTLSETLTEMKYSEDTVIDDIVKLAESTRVLIGEESPRDKKKNESL